MEMTGPRPQNNTLVERTIQSSELIRREFLPAGRIFLVAIHRDHSLPVVLPDMPVD